MKNSILAEITTPTTPKKYYILGWTYYYDGKFGIWRAFHKDNPTDEWNAYDKSELLWQMDHKDDPNNQDMLIKTVENPL